MQNKPKYPKHQTLLEKYQQQLERLEKAKEQRRNATRFITSQMEIRNLARLAKN